MRLPEGGRFRIAGMNPPRLPGTLQSQLDVLSDRPGVYLFRDSDGEILYVGKAASLRTRVRRYFRGGGAEVK